MVTYEKQPAARPPSSQAAVNRAGLVRNGVVRAGLLYEGTLRSAGRRFAIVASRFNDAICEGLVDGALDAVHRSGGVAGDVEVFRCPGALEIPGLLRLVVETGRFDAVICLGAVIRGATPHFDLVVNQAVAGIAQIGADARIPVTCGVLACDNIEQAIERSGAGAGNRGTDAALAAIEMADVYAAIKADQVGGGSPPASGASGPK